MKKMYGLVAEVITLVLLFSSCAKNNSSLDFAQIDDQKVQIQTSLNLTSKYNDTLKMVYDTVKLRKDNPYCIKYDKLYHKNDSMFTMHYGMFGDEMYKNGIMMNGYTPGTGMMQGGMMNNNSVDLNRMMGDTAIVGGYHRNMLKLHIQHQVYHNSIYN